MKYFLSTLVSIGLIIGSLRAAASSADAANLMSLIPCSEPLPFDANLSDIELLTRPEQFKSDIARMALVMEVAEVVEAGRVANTLSMPPLMIRCLVSHPSIGKRLDGCSSNLGKFFHERSKSAEHHPAHDVHEAVVALFTKSKATWDATPTEERDTWLLNECAQRNCPATRIRFPDVRTKFEQTFIESVQTKSGNRSVYASIGSGSLAQDLRLLQLLAEHGVHLDTVVAVDTTYNTLMYQSTTRNEHGAIETPFAEPLPIRVQYPDMYYASFYHDYNALMLKETNSDSAAFSRELAIKVGLQASDSAFTKTLHPYATARVIDQFKKAALAVQPGLKRMYVCASVAHYLQDCKTRPELRADMLNGCDFIHLRSLASDPYWRKCWEDFYAAQEHCLAPSAVSCALMTMASNHALMQVYHEADKKIQQWDCLDGAWRELSEGEVNHNRSRDWIFALTHPVAMPKPAVSVVIMQPTQVAKPKVTKPAPRAQQKKKRNARNKGRRR